MVRPFRAVSIKGQTKLDADPDGKQEALKAAFSVSSKFLRGWMSQTGRSCVEKKKSRISDFNIFFIFHSPDAYFDIDIILLLDVQTFL